MRKPRKSLHEPVSTKAPTELELKQSAELKEYLESLKLYESYEEAVTRQEILGRLDKICKDWVRKASRMAGKRKSTRPSRFLCAHHALESPRRTLPPLAKKDIQ